MENFEITNTDEKCTGCGNRCSLRISTFSSGSHFISGNRCEKGALRFIGPTIIPELTKSEAEDIGSLDMFDYKYKRLFSYRPLPENEAPLGVIGIPRVLNIYEHYPFWYTFFTGLGFRVQLSRPTSSKTAETGLETLPSESICYPAKLAHGHILDLVQRGIKLIFYPSIPYEIKERQDHDNNYNCPVVTSYPEVIHNNLDELQENNVRFLHPFLPLHNRKRMLQRLKEELKSFRIPSSKLTMALDAAYQEVNKYKAEIRERGEKILEYIEKKGQRGIVLVGRPYHIDPEIHHGIPGMILSNGLAVLSEDSVAHLGADKIPLSVVNQWVFHSRLYAAADFVSKRPDLELVQLNSFGCGLDAVTTDQVQDILEKKGKIYSLLKIDEVKNLGAARIRIRSLKAAVREREKKERPISRKVREGNNERVLFTSQMRETHTILFPQMAPYHFQFMEAALQGMGFRAELPPQVGKEAVEAGLKYVNNDACYPSILTVGQVAAAFESRRYDPQTTAVLMSQTGGGCRATNYVSFTRRALREAGFPGVPVISLNNSDIEDTPGFSLSKPLLHRMMMATTYGDLFMKLLYATRPYEAVPGTAEAFYRKWSDACFASVRSGKMREFNRNIEGIVNDFDTLPLRDIVKPKVGIVGEILVKYHPEANNHLVELLEQEGTEVVVPEFAAFVQYCEYDRVANHKYLAGQRGDNLKGYLSIKYTEYYQRQYKKSLAASERFTPPASIYEMAKKAENILSTCNQTGEGWLLTAEMIELLEQGVNNIVCVQPFACLPNQITGKGMLKTLRRMYPGANIVPIDYDPGSSEVNQINRIKLMLSPLRPPQGGVL